MLVKFVTCLEAPSDSEYSSLWGFFYVKKYGLTHHIRGPKGSMFYQMCTWIYLGLYLDNKLIFYVNQTKSVSHAQPMFFFLLRYTIYVFNAFGSHI